MALLGIVPALLLLLLMKFWRPEPGTENAWFDSMVAGMVGGGAVMLITVFRTFPSLAPSFLLKIDSIVGLLRLAGVAVLAGVAFQVLARKFAGKAFLSALVMAAISVALPAVPWSYWGLRNESHPLGGRPGFFIGLTVTVVVFLAILLLLNRLLRNRERSRQVKSWWFGLVSLGVAAGALLPIIFSSGPVVSDEAINVEGDRNVILFTVDTLRADAVDLGDPASSPTPHLARLAAQGTRFDNTQAQCPWTLPSLASMMTSIHPSGQGLLSARQRLDSARQTLAEAMTEAGYLTQAVVCNAWLTDDFGLHQGFTGYIHVWEEGASEYWMDTIWIRLTRRFNPEFLKPPNTHDSKEMVNRAIEFIRSNKQSNFFLWVHVIDPHDPYAPLGRYRAMAAEGYRGKLPRRNSGNINMLRRGRRLEAEDRAHLRKLYDLEVRYTDEQFGRLIEVVEELGLMDKTLVAFTSDHGEEFWDHENIGHGHTLYDEVTRVPLVIKPPAGMEPVPQVTSQVRLIDLAPTILDLVDLQPLAEGQGESLVPLMTGEESGETAGDRLSFAEALIYFGEKKSVDDGRYRFILSPNSGREELYDLEADPEATRNLVQELPEEAARLRAELTRHLRSQEEYLDSLDKIEGVGEKVLDSRMRERLQKLGYLQ
jgi:arylsulfatase A-like enzyme